MFIQDFLGKRIENFYKKYLLLFNATYEFFKEHEYNEKLNLDYIDLLLLLFKTEATDRINERL